AFCLMSRDSGQFLLLHGERTTNYLFQQSRGEPVGAQQHAGGQRQPTSWYSYGRIHGNSPFPSTVCFPARCSTRTSPLLGSLRLSIIPRRGSSPYTGSSHHRAGRL